MQDGLSLVLSGTSAQTDSSELMMHPFRIGVEEFETV